MLKTAWSVLSLVFLLVACTSSSDNQSQNSFSYTPVGQQLSADYTVNNLFVGSGNVYLTLTDTEDSTFGYARVATTADASTAYQFEYLTLPSSPQYIIIGDMVIDEHRAQLYVPVASQSGAFYNYTWLQYEAGATEPNSSLVGSYQVAMSSANQFALNSAAFFNGSIYANYGGHIIGFNTVNGQVAQRKDNFFVSSQDAFWIQDKNTVVAIGSDANSVVRKDPESNTQTQIGESFSTLEDQGFEVSPHFTVHDGVVSILAIKRSETTDLAHLTLCRVGLQSDTNRWTCAVSNTPLPADAQIINIDTDAVTGSMYFVLHSLAQGSQLYKIN